MLSDNEATGGQIVQLLDAHGALKQAFRNYQRALLRKDFASARQIFERYERALRGTSGLKRTR